MDGTDTRSDSGQGVGVERFGSRVIDPTKNVADLVEAKSKSDDALRKAEQRFLDAQLSAAAQIQDVAREAESKFQNFAREAESKFQSSRTDAETRRIDQLAQNRQEFLNTIREMLAESVRTTSTLVSTQLVQIQATFDTRVSKLEAQAFTAAGRSSVADPAIEGAMTRMSQSISGLAASSTEAMNKMAAANAEAMTRLTATMGVMQTSAAKAAGEHGGEIAATTAQIVSETLKASGLATKSGANQNIITLVIAVIAAASLLFAVLRQTPAPEKVYIQREGPTQQRQQYNERLQPLKPGLRYPVSAISTLAGSTGARLSVVGAQRTARLAHAQGWRTDRASSGRSFISRPRGERRSSHQTVCCVLPVWALHAMPGAPQPAQVWLAQAP